MRESLDARAANRCGLAGAAPLGTVSAGISSDELVFSAVETSRFDDASQFLLIEIVSINTETIIADDCAGGSGTTSFGTEVRAACGANLFFV